MMSLWDALRMNMMISYQELVRTFLSSHSAKVVGLSNLLDNNKIKEILAENI
ncbi:PTS ascorbate transporter subunit IIB [Klebsiella pneumoniae]|nr:PTS ascorbate transporter subunit IIB [Klebsiella pneumoniae]SYG79964.1 PTS ascorbate transporter subunit IIB [Klebsiella pneumoniae]SYG88926.1 PTS ascorbate transporter subunit IIB [Klebsiella pneumoniae]SYH15576.1 PTS ascorbate transporter subunit IIB [Klebsiella pneumoniae]SYH18464.1 PTS ascorbate transporter subunit IIB [Klebsiella pneumoniae]